MNLLDYLTEDKLTPPLRYSCTMVSILDPCRPSRLASHLPEGLSPIVRGGFAWREIMFAHYTSAYSEAYADRDFAYDEVGLGVHAKGLGRQGVYYERLWLSNQTGVDAGFRYGLNKEVGNVRITNWTAALSEHIRVSVKPTRIPIPGVFLRSSLDRFGVYGVDKLLHTPVVAPFDILSWSAVLGKLDRIYVAPGVSSLFPDNRLSPLAMVIVWSPFEFRMLGPVRGE